MKVPHSESGQLVRVKRLRPKDSYDPSLKGTIGIFILDGFPDLIRVLFERKSDQECYLLVQRATTMECLYEIPAPFTDIPKYHFDRKSICTWNLDNSKMLVLTCKNGKLLPETVACPKDAIYVLKSDEATYFICPRLSHDCLFHNGSSEPMLRYARGSIYHASLVGRFFVVLIRFKNYIKVHALRGGAVEYVRELTLPFKTISIAPLTDRHLIALGTSGDGAIVDCVTKRVLMFMYVPNDWIWQCTARFCGSFVEMYLLTPDHHIHKARVNLSGISAPKKTTGHEPVPFEKENAEQEPKSHFIASKISLEAEQNDSISAEQETSDSLRVVYDVSGETFKEQDSANITDGEEERTSETEQWSCEQELATYSIGSSTNTEIEQEESTSTEQEASPTDSLSLIPDVLGESSTEQERARFSYADEESREIKRRKAEIEKKRAEKVAELAVLDEELSKMKA